MGRLEGKVAIITGATSGIGRAAARVFAADGAMVAIVGRRQAEGRQVEAEIAEAGGTAAYFAADVMEEDSVRDMVAEVVSRFGGVDILYNNAGGSTNRDNSVVEAPMEEFWRAIRLDLLGTWLCSRYTIPEMIRRSGGSIINTGSIVAMMGVKRRAAYTASKGGVSALTRSMAVEFAEHQIRVNAVVPGVVATERIRPFLEKEAHLAALVAEHPLGIADPEDIARTALFLASDDSRRITGQLLPVDGGFLVA